MVRVRRSICIRKVAFIVMALLSCVKSSSLFAQQRVEAGIFLDYLSISQTNTSNFGVGARFGYRIHRNLMMEGELAYDYGINFEEAYRNVENGNITAIERTSVGVTHRLFGPTLEFAQAGRSLAKTDSTFRQEGANLIDHAGSSCHQPLAYPMQSLQIKLIFRLDGYETHVLPFHSFGIASASR